MSSIFVNATHPSAKPSHVAFRFVVPNAQAKTHPINQVFLDQKSGVLYVHPHALQTTLLSTFAVHQNLSASCSSAHRSRYPRGLSSSACSRSCLSQTWVSHGSTRDPGRAPTTAWHVKRESSLQTLGQFLPSCSVGTRWKIAKTLGSAPWVQPSVSERPHHLSPSYSYRSP